MPARAVSVHHWSLWTNVCLSKKATFPSLMLQGQLSLAVSLSKVIKASAAPLVYTHWRWIHTVNSLICPAGTQQHIIYGAEPVLCLSHGQHLRLFQSKVPFCTKTKKKKTTNNAFIHCSVQKLEEQCAEGPSKETEIYRGEMCFPLWWLYPNTYIKAPLCSCRQPELDCVKDTDCRELTQDC